MEDPREYLGDGVYVRFDGYHPPKSDYVNNHKHTLHLWRPTDKELPRPDSILVVIKIKP